MRTFQLYAAKKSFIPYFLIALPIVYYIAFIIIYGENVPEGDDYTALTLVRKSYLGTLTFFDLWKNHNGHRMLFPNLLFLLDGRLFHFNLKILMYFGWLFTTISFVFLYLVFRKNNRLSAWGMVPVAFLIFTLSQAINILWGFQIAWYLILACLSGMIFLLVNKNEKPWAYFSAACLGIIASFSSFQGLFLWPSGLVCLLLLNFRLKKIVGWILISCLTVWIYFSGYNAPTIMGHSMFSISRVIHFSYMFFVYLGAIFPLGILPLHMELNHLLSVLAGIGLALFLFGIYAVIYGISKVRQNKEFIAPLSLFVFVLLFQASLAVGRGTIGLFPAIQGHYATFSILYLIAVYLIIVLAYMFKKNNIRYMALFLSLLVVIVVQVSAANYTGKDQGKNFRSEKERVAEIIQRHGGMPDLLSKIIILKYVTWGAYLNGFDKDIRFAKKYHLTLFASSYIISKDFSQKEQLPPENLLPVPGSVASLLGKDDNYSHAWYILSYLHNEKPDLHQAFPITSERSVKSIHKLIQWALIPTNDISDLIDPYRKSLIELDRRLQKQDKEQ
ncbi:MAG: hypothetical protein M1537_06990 [Nitrospirae bacterium]|nr:hypothetical protein [Nitrospirota bacterium]MCL5285671.1 hypothetical protein [Nitrospirota bacterium]